MPPNRLLAGPSPAGGHRKGQSCSTPGESWRRSRWPSVSPCSSLPPRCRRAARRRPPPTPRTPIYSSPRSAAARRPWAREQHDGRRYLQHVRGRAGERERRCGPVRDHDHGAGQGRLRHPHRRRGQDPLVWAWIGIEITPNQTGYITPVDGLKQVKTTTTFPAPVGLHPTPHATSALRSWHAVLGPAGRDDRVQVIRGTRKVFGKLSTRTSITATGAPSSRSRPCSHRPPSRSAAPNAQAGPKSRRPVPWPTGAQQNGGDA